MPRPYNEAVMTAAGAILLDKVHAGLAAIEFTRMAAGDGTYTAEEKVSSALRECTGLKSSRNSYALSSVSTIPDGGVKLTVLFTDQDPVTGEALVSEGYHINEIGLYAKEEDADDSTEVLYSITVAAGDIGDYMPAYTGGAPVQIVQEYHAKVSDTASVSICSTGAVMLAEDAERRFSAIEEKVETAGGGPIGDEIPTFEEAETREDIASGDSLGTILGKIKKFFTDLKKVAFTGSYDDLSDKPELFSGDYGDLSNKPELFSGDYDDLSGKPDIPGVPAGITSGYVQTGKKEGTTIGRSATAEGYNTEAVGSYAHAEGSNTRASALYSHAEGNGTTASGAASHAEGNASTASGESSHVEGEGNTAGSYGSHAEGVSAMASGDRGSHAEGYGTTASGAASHAEGRKTVASNYASHAGGHYNKTMTNGGKEDNQVGDALVIGNGIRDGSRSNALRVTYGGATYGVGAFNTSGADYAEFIKPWHDDNPDDEDRVGYFVTVKDGLLYKADAGDYIAGITSGSPSVVGNADEDYYHRWERDEFGRIVWEDVPEMIGELDEGGRPVTDEEGMPVMVPTGRMIKNGRMKERADYDPSLQESYIERKDRPEWDYVGMLGVLPVRDDGTCVPGSFCRCADGGIATLATERGLDTYMVIERITDSVVRVILR